MEKEKTLIEQKYDALFEKDENWKALDEESFLNALINLESAWKRKLFRTLLRDKTKEEVREYLQTKSREDWEKIVWKDYLGKKMTISDVIDQYSEMVKNVFKTKKIKEAVKEAGIKCEQVDGVILPPEWQQRLILWGSEWWEDDKEKKTLKFTQYQEKSPILFWDILTVENGIYPWDIIFFEWTNEKNALRYTWYVAIQIPKLKKTIFINNMKWEATFVCDKLLSEEDMKKSKKRLSKELWDAFHSVSYLEDKKESWKLNMIDLIFWQEKWSQKFARYIREKYQKLDSSHRLKWFWSAHTYHDNIEEITQYFSNWMPRSRVWLISLLWGTKMWWDKIYQAAGYVQALLTSKENGNLYLVEWEENFETEEKKFVKTIREKYQKLDDTLKSKWFASAKAFNTNKKEILEYFWEWTPISFNWLIWLLWGNKTNLSWGYLQALLRSEADGNQYLINWKEKIEQEKQESIRIIRSKYQLLDRVLKNKWFSCSNAYEDNVDEITESFWTKMPKSRPWLISLLWGNNKCLNRDYVQALLESKEKGEEYYNKWKENLENEQILKIREKYNELNDIQKVKRFSSRKIYDKNFEEIKAYFWGLIPKSREWLIRLLWGDRNCLSWWYMQALLKSEEAWKLYLQKNNP